MLLIVSLSHEDKSGTCDSEQETVDYCKSFRNTDTSGIMLDLKRIIVLCLPSLLFAATMEPGKPMQSHFDCFKVLASHDTQSRCLPTNFFLPSLRQLVELARIQFSPSAMSLGNLFSTWSCVMRCFYAVENGLLRGSGGRPEKSGNVAT